MTTVQQQQDWRLVDLLATLPVDEDALVEARARRRRVLEDARARTERAMHALLEAIRIAEWHYETLAIRLEAHDRRAAGVESKLRAQGYLT